MGDAPPSLAPQWLKSSTSLNLRPQSQIGAPTGTSDDSNRGGSWRESGSRLGLGAGADRETSLDNNSQSLLSARRDRSGFQDRSSSRAYQTSTAERRGNFARSSVPNPPRQLSDRELLESTPSLKLRPGSRLGGDTFLDDSYKPVLNHKEVGDRGVRGRLQGQRKPLGSQRPGALAPQKVEKDFTNLGRHSQPKVISSGLVSPRPAQTEQSWTSRLADAVPNDSHQAFETPLLTSNSAPSAPGTAAAEPAQRAAPRMADTILQAQANAAQEVEAARTAKARKEQLALRQSKQLIPVIQTKAKHPASILPQGGASLTSLKKPSGLEPLGKLPALVPALRKEEDLLPSSRSIPTPVSARSLQGDPVAGTASPRSSRPARERDRLTFFSSLRRKASGGEAHGSDEGWPLQRQASSSTSEAVEALSPKENNGVVSDLFSAKSTVSGDCKVAINGKHDEEPKMTPEELAFMRSLGWEENTDDAAGGLTEEEVAAFKAQCPPNKRCQAKITSPAKQIPVKSNGAMTTTDNVNKQHLSRSFHSELEFSDSDSQ